MRVSYFTKMIAFNFILAAIPVLFIGIFFVLQDVR